MTVRETIESMADIVIRRFNPLRLVLFGSHARGEAGPDSVRAPHRDHTVIVPSITVVPARPQ
jgi:hypothetical protein